MWLDLFPFVPLFGCVSSFTPPVNMIVNGIRNISSYPLSTHFIFWQPAMENRLSKIYALYKKTKYEHSPRQFHKNKGSIVIGSALRSLLSSSHAFQERTDLNKQSGVVAHEAANCEKYSDSFFES